MACNGYAVLKLLELATCVACMVYKRISDWETTQIFFTRQKFSNEWPLLNTITWDRNGSTFADIVYGGFIIITFVMFVSYLADELDRARILESLFLGLGCVLFLAVGSLELAAIEMVPHQLVKNAAALGVVSLFGGLLFLLDLLLCGRRRNSLKKDKMNQKEKMAAATVPAANGKANGHANAMENGRHEPVGLYKGPPENEAVIGQLRHSLKEANADTAPTAVTVIDTPPEIQFKSSLKRPAEDMNHKSTPMSNGVVNREASVLKLPNDADTDSLHIPSVSFLLAERDRERERERELLMERERAAKERERLEKERARLLEREREIERERDRERERERERELDRERERKRERERELERERERERSRDRDRDKSDYRRDSSRDRDRDHEREHERLRSRSVEMDAPSTPRGRVTSGAASPADSSVFTEGRPRYYYSDSPDRVPSRAASVDDLERGYLRSNANDTDEPQFVEIERMYRIQRFAGSKERGRSEGDTPAPSASAAASPEPAGLERRTGVLASSRSLDWARTEETSELSRKWRASGGASSGNAASRAMTPTSPSDPGFVLHAARQWPEVRPTSPSPPTPRRPSPAPPPPPSTPAPKVGTGIGNGYGVPSKVRAQSHGSESQV